MEKASPVYQPVKTNYFLNIISGLLLPIVLFSQSSIAGPREQAKRIHDRLAGTPPSEIVLNDMQTDIEAGNPMTAAYKAMDDDAFYSVTLKNWITPWTNEPQTVFAPLNDYTATVIGMIRDDVDIREMLSADIIYTGQSGLGLPAYANDSNAHYEAIES